MWLTVPTSDLKFWYVTKIKIYTEIYTIGYRADISCEARPCRVNPNNNNLGLWLEGVENGLKLNLVKTDQVVNGGELLRLEIR